MNFDELTLWALARGFVRASSVLLAVPLVNGLMPVKIRLCLALCLSVAAAPVVLRVTTVLPSTLVDLLCSLGEDVGVGVIIGGFFQLIVGFVQAAGGLCDLQVGTASAQILNPIAGGLSTPIAQFFAMLGSVLIFALDGHHIIIQAFVQSYNSDLTLDKLTVDAVASLGHELFGVAVGIAAPILAITMIIDTSAGLLNKAIPQTQPFLLSLPVKLSLGFVLISLGLPFLVKEVERSMLSVVWLLKEAGL